MAEEIVKLTFNGAGWMTCLKQGFLGQVSLSIDIGVYLCDGAVLPRATVSMALQKFDSNV